MTWTSTTFDSGFRWMTKDQKKILVNLRNISYIEDHNNFTIIYFNDNSKLYVDESLAQIENIIGSLK